MFNYSIRIFEVFFTGLSLRWLTWILQFGPKKNNFKKTHKIIFTILSLIGMLGLTFGISVFLVLGNERITQADTTSSKTENLSQNKMIAVTSNVSSKPATSNLDHAVQVEPVKSKEVSDQVNYTVQEGDSLSTIANQFQISMTSIMQQNELTSSEAIYVGQVLAFTKSYVVKEETNVSLDTDEVLKTQDVSINNGNKVAAGGLSDEDRTYVLTQLQTRTGVDASQWDYIISRESGWIPTIKNSLGYYGLFQLAPSYPGYDGDVQSQIEGAVYLFNHGGMTHWAL
jgi:LysM repeat protein